MNRISKLSVATVALAFASTLGAQDAAIAVKDGGIKVAGWTGKIDAVEESRGNKLENSKLEKMGNDIHVTTGPQGAFWMSNATASGNYTVSAKFTEPKFMNLMNHPHPYGLFIGGNDMGSANATYFYCAAYGSGSFIARGFGPAPFRLNGGRGETHAAVNKAAGKDQPVTQEIALSVKGDKVECSVNGKVVGSYDKSAVVGEGKLKSLDGVYGLRFGHNTEAVVTGLTMTKN
jgi:hypothetical protein